MSKAAQRQRFYGLAIRARSPRPFVRLQFRATADTWEEEARRLGRKALKGRAGRIVVTKPDGSTWEGAVGE